MPKATKRTPVNVRRIDAGSLLDAKRFKKSKNRIMRLVMWAAAVGIVVSGAFLGFFIFHNNPLNSGFTPEIIVPEPGQSRDSQPPATTTPALSEPSVQIQQVEVLPTPTGYLNVRQQPTTGSAKIAQIHPGEVYELVSVDGKAGWYQIKLTDGRMGWVTKQYARIK